MRQQSRSSPDPSGRGSSDGTPVQLWDCSADRNRQQMTAGSTVVNPRTGKCLDVSGSTANDTRTHLRSCNRTAAQQWRCHTNGTATNTQSGTCLDAGGSDSAALLQIRDCWATSNQVWSRK
ncbi:RICIN domain-containing protein [Streptomyces sp. CT34]|uniref:RICIN domain-containing protein n=1 Tax=Streptomyces sp. CT34 TaxID=1553907 RepID=UPI0012FF1BE0|nr:RICIN domain-containing protein [Streptomyces sp. CT34]